MIRICLGQNCRFRSQISGRQRLSWWRGGCDYKDEHGNFGGQWGGDGTAQCPDGGNGYTHLHRC